MAFIKRTEESFVENVGKFGRVQIEFGDKEEIKLN